MKSFIRIVMVLCAITAQFALSGCGSGGAGNAQNAGVTTSSSNDITTPESSGNSYLLTEDTYGLNCATFMSTEFNNTGGLVMRAAIAEQITLTNPADIFRIDILQPSSISVNSTYSLGNNIEHPNFPGEIQFFNGYQSTFLNTTSGTITFTSYGANSGNVVAGSFEVQVENQDPANDPRPTYSITGNFSFVVNSSGPILTHPNAD